MKSILATLIVLIVTSVSLPAHGVLVFWPATSGGNNHWYEAVPLSEGLTWEQANMTARARGGYLADIRTAEENAFVFNLIDAPQYWVSVSGDFTFADGPWIGALQADVSNEPAGNFIWSSDGSPVLFANWDPGQPDNFLGDENYVKYFTFGSLARSDHWNDAPGEVVSAYVIEYTYNPTRLLSILDGPYINPKNGHRYSLLEPGTWLASESAAMRFGGHLATIRTQQEQDFIITAFGKNRHLLIGLYDTDPFHNASNPLIRRTEFAWSSGEPLLFSRWLDGEPNNYGNSGEFWGQIFAGSFLGENGQPVTSIGGYWNDLGATDNFGGVATYGVLEEIPTAPAPPIDPGMFQMVDAPGDTPVRIDTTTGEVVGVNRYVIILPKLPPGGPIGRFQVADTYGTPPIRVDTATGEVMGVGNLVIIPYKLPLGNILGRYQVIDPPGQTPVRVDTMTGEVIGVASIVSMSARDPYGTTVGRYQVADSPIAAPFRVDTATGEVTTRPHNVNIPAALPSATKVGRFQITGTFGPIRLDTATGEVVIQTPKVVIPARLPYATTIGRFRLADSPGDVPVRIDTMTGEVVGQGELLLIPAQRPAGGFLGRFQVADADGENPVRIDTSTGQVVGIAGISTIAAEPAVAGTIGRFQVENSSIDAPVRLDTISGEIVGQGNLVIIPAKIPVVTPAIKIWIKGAAK